METLTCCLFICNIGGENMKYDNFIRSITSIGEFIDAISDLKKRFIDGKVVYRGEPQYYETNCCPNIFRNKKYNLEPRFEKHILDELKGEDMICGEPYLIRAIEAQHGGFPSRLLDVSYNALVALFFAVTPYYKQDIESLDDKDGYVFLINMDNSYSPFDDAIQKLYKDIISGSNLTDLPYCRYNHKFIEHVSINERISAQQGAFIMFQGKYYSPLASWRKYTIKIEKSYKKIIRKELQELFGLTTGFIYPEISNKVDDLSERILCRSTVEINLISELKDALNEMIDNFSIKLSTKMENNTVKYSMLEQVLADFKMDMDESKRKILKSKPSKINDINLYFGEYNAYIEKEIQKIKDYNFSVDEVLLEVI